MTRKPRAKADPMEQEIERALKPGAFVSDGACFSFVTRLVVVAAKIDQFTSGDPARAVTLYETFLAGCYAKIEELDDSSGSFGQFVTDLYRGWIKARQADGANPDETASRLFAWIDDDPYGFCYRLEKDAAEVLDKAGLAAFVKQVRVRFDGAASATPEADRTSEARRERVRRRWGEALRALYLAQKNLEAYLALAEETGLTAQDCHSIATLLVARRKPEEALVWVERGIDLHKKAPPGSMAGYDLTKLERELLTRLGRSDEALAAAWADYREHPSKYTYDGLMKFVPEAERTQWHDKAIEAASGSDLPSIMELLLATKELDRLADLLHRTTDQALEGLGHYATELVAKKLDRTRPDLAARLWRAQGMRSINTKKSKYHNAALANFERAKRCFERAGLTAEWEKTVSQVRAGHQRKAGFMSGFEALVAGAGPSDQPSFLESAKARWSGRQRREDE
jgi:Family of unknown function (DUF6880)